MDDEAAHRGTKQGPDQCGDDDEVHRHQQFRFVKSANDRESAHRHHHRRADTLQHARDHQHWGIDGQTAQNRGSREDRHRDAKYLSSAESIRHPATDWNADGQAQDVAGHDGFQTQRRHLQTRRHRRNRGVDDGGVELLHE